jgi:hypothetical protein
MELARLIPAGDPHRFDAYASGCLALDKAKKTDAAIDAYREFLAVVGADASEYYPELLMRLAILLQEKGTLDESAATFLRLAEVAATPDRAVRKTFDLKKARTDSLWNAALLLEKAGILVDVSRREPGAATVFSRFAAVTTEGNRAVEALTRSAIASGKGGDWKTMGKTFADARKKFAAEPYATIFIFLGYSEEAKLLEAAGKVDDAERVRKETLKAFDESADAKPGTPAAVYAGEARFWLAEKVYKTRFEPYKVEWKGKVDQEAMTRTVEAWRQVVIDTQAEFNDVVRFKSQWGIAAAVRFGDVCYYGAQKILEAAPPKELAELDAKDPKAGAVKQYREQLGELVAPLVDSARTAWKQAAEANPPSEWSATAKERLALLKK